MAITRPRSRRVRDSFRALSRGYEAPALLAPHANRAVRSLAAASLIAATGCRAHDATPASSASTAGGHAVAVDDFGDTVPTAPARRIVSLNPTTTELLFAIGAGDRVVGRTQYDAWPAAAKRVADLGPGLRPSVERVIATRPDLVILYAAADNRDAARTLHTAGIRTLSLKIDHLADFPRAATLLGQVTGRAAAAQATVDSVQRTLDRVRRSVAALPRPRVLWFLWDNPPLVLGNGSYQSELLEIAGGANVYADRTEPAAQVSMEDILARNPTVILADPGADTTLRASPRWRTVDAVRSGRVIAIDDTLLNRPGVTLGMAAVSLARELHPGWTGP